MCVCSIEGQGYKGYKVTNGIIGGIKMNGYEYAKSMLQKNIQMIPLTKNKRPLLKFADIEITDEFIEEHKELYLNTNVLGILTRGLWCIDIDVDHTKNENGFDSIKKNPFHEEIKENYQQTLVQITATGGQHIVFKKRAGVNYRQKIGYLNSVDLRLMTIISLYRLEV